MVVVPLKRTSGTVKNLENPDEMDMEEVGYGKAKGARLLCHSINYYVNWLHEVKKNEAYKTRKGNFKKTFVMYPFVKRLSSFFLHG